MRKDRCRHLSAWVLPFAFGVAFLSPSAFRAQAIGEVSATAGVLEGGGPDIAHQREDSLEGLSISGALGVFGGSNAAHFDGAGLGSPDFRLRGAFYQKDLVLEFSGIQRAYLFGGDARFAWDPQSGVLDGRVPGILAQYRPYSGSPVVHFDPATLIQARSLLPEGSPGWVLREGHLGVRTTDRPTGFEVALDWTQREGLFPRTFVTATGFTPLLTPVTVDLPVGNPLGVVEVPERLDERSMAFSLRAFARRGSWRWEGSARVEGFTQDRPVDVWQSPFPGPEIRQPRSYEASSSRLRFEGKSPEVRIRVEYLYRKGDGEGGRRTLEDARADIQWSRTRGDSTWYLRGVGFLRNDWADIYPQGPHPVFAGPFYDLLGPRQAESHAHSRPIREVRAEGGLRTRAWDVSATLRDLRRKDAYAGRCVTAEASVRWTPIRPLVFTLRPFYTWASRLDPAADALGHHADWQQAKNFLPADARNWKGANGSIRFARGMWYAQYTGSVVTSPPDLGLRSRSFHDLTAGATAENEKWKLSALARLSSSMLSLDATTYASPGDALDPMDPSHRAAIPERWERRGGSVRLELERDLPGGHEIGLRGRYEDQRLTTEGTLDSGRRYQYWRSGLFGRLQRGLMRWEVECGVEGYHRTDPMFLPPDPPPGPYLWAGLTERPGTRPYASLTFAVRF